MNKTEFVIDYYARHPWMSVIQAADAAETAWERLHNRPTGDVLQWWMQDARMMLDVDRALRTLNGAQL